MGQDISVHNIVNSSSSDHATHQTEIDLECLSREHTVSVPWCIRSMMCVFLGVVQRSHRRLIYALRIVTASTRAVIFPPLIYGSNCITT